MDYVIKRFTFIVCDIIFFISAGELILSYT